MSSPLEDETMPDNSSNNASTLEIPDVEVDDDETMDDDKTVDKEADMDEFEDVDGESGSQMMNDDETETEVVAEVDSDQEAMDDDDDEKEDAKGEIITHGTEEMKEREDEGEDDDDIDDEDVEVVDCDAVDETNDGTELDGALVSVGTSAAVDAADVEVVDCDKVRDADGSNVDTNAGAVAAAIAADDADATTSASTNTGVNAAVASDTPVKKDVAESPSKVMKSPSFEVFADANETNEPPPIKSPLPATHSKENETNTDQDQKSDDDDDDDDDDSEDQFLPTQDETEEFDDLEEPAKVELAEDETKPADSEEQGVATTISDEKKAATASQIEEKGDGVSAISNTDVKKERSQEDLATTEANDNEADRELNAEPEVSIKEEDVDEKASTATVDLDAPSATVDAAEETATTSNSAPMDTTEETTEPEPSDIPIDDKDDEEDDEEVIDENKITQSEEEARAQSTSMNHNLHLSTLETQYTTTLRERDHLRDLTATQSQELSTLRESHNAVQTQRDRILAQKQRLELSLKREVEELASSNQSSLDTSDRLTLENDRLRNEITRLTGDVSKFQTEALEQQSRCQTTEAQVTPLQLKIQTQTSEIQSLETHAQFLESRAQTHESSYADQQFQFTQEQSDLRTKVEELTTENRLLQNDKSSMNNSNNTLHQSIARISNELREQKLEAVEVNQAHQQELLLEKAANRELLLEMEQYRSSAEDSQKQLASLQGLARLAGEDTSKEREVLMEESRKALLDVARDFQEEIADLKRETKELATQRDTAVREMEAVRDQRVVSNNRRVITSPTQQRTPARGMRTSMSVRNEVEDETPAPTSVIDLLDKLSRAQDDLQVEQAERKKCELYLQKVLVEIESKTPLIQQQRREFEATVQGRNALQQRLQDALQEQHLAEEQSHGLEARVSELKRDKEELATETKGLARQVQTLLHRQAQIPQAAITENDNDGNLIEFDSISELQSQNQRLLREHHRLSSKLSEAETKIEEDPVRQNLQAATEELDQLRDDRDRQAALVGGIVQQRDLYRALLAQHDSSLNENTEPKLLLAASQSPDNKQLTQLQTSLESQSNQLAAKTAEHNSLVIVKESLEERIERLDSHAANISNSLDESQQHLQAANANLARTAAELQYVQERCERLENEFQGSKREVERLAKVRLDLQTINTQLETNNKMAQNSLHALERTNASYKVKLQLVETQANAGRNQEARLQIETEVLRGELARQKTLLDSVQRIEATLEAKSFTELQGLQEQVTKLTSKLELETQEHALALEQVSSKLESTTVLYTDLQSRSAAKEVQAMECHTELVDENARNQALQAELTTIQTELNKTKELLKPEDEERATAAAEQISTLQTQLVESQAEITKLVERVASYQQAAKDGDVALLDLTQLSNTYKENTTLKLTTLTSQLESKTKIAEDRQVALDEISGELSMQTNTKGEEITELKTKMSGLEVAIKGKARDIKVMQTRIEELQGDFGRVKDEAKASENNYERELDLHATARTALRASRDQCEAESQKHQQTQSNLDALRGEITGIQRQFQDENKQLEQLLAETSTNLKETRDQNGILHRQMETLGKTVQELQKKRIDSAAEVISTTAERAEETTGDKQLQETIAELREVIRYMRTERERLDAQMEELKTSMEREKAAASVAKQSLTEARMELETHSTQQTSATTPTDDEQKQRTKKIRETEDHVLLLRESNTLLREEFDRVSAELESSKTEWDLFKTKMTPLERKNRDLENDKVALEAEKQGLQSEINAWKGRVQTLVSRFNQIDPEDYKKVQAEVEKVKKECLTLKVLKEKAEQGSLSARTIVARLNKDISQQKAALETATKSLAKITAEKDLLAAKSVQGNSANSVVVKERDVLREQAKSLQKSAESTKAELDASNKRLDNLKGMMRRNKGGMDELKKSYQQSKAREEVLTKQLEESQQQAQNLKKDDTPASSPNDSVDEGSIKGGSSDAVKVPSDTPPTASASSTTKEASSAAKDISAKKTTTTVAPKKRSKIPAPEIPSGGFKYAPSALSKIKAAAYASSAKTTRLAVSRKNNTPANPSSSGTGKADAEIKIKVPAGGKGTILKKLSATSGVDGETGGSATSASSNTVTSKPIGATSGKTEPKIPVPGSLPSSGGTKRSASKLGVDAQPEAAKKVFTAESQAAALRQRLLDKKKKMIAMQQAAAAKKGEKLAISTPLSSPLKKARMAASPAPGQVTKVGASAVSDKVNKTQADIPSGSALATTVSSTVSTNDSSVSSAKPVFGMSAAPPTFGSSSLQSKSEGQSVKPFGSTFGIKMSGGTSEQKGIFGSSSATTKSAGGSSEGSAFLTLAPPGSNSQPFTFGSSATIKLSAPSNASIASPSSNPFGAFHTAASPSPFFQGSKKRPLEEPVSSGDSKIVRVDTREEKVAVKTAAGTKEDSN